MVSEDLHSCARSEILSDEDFLFVCLFRSIYMIQSGLGAFPTFAFILTDV